MISLFLIIALILGTTVCAETNVRTFRDDCGREIALSDAITSVVPSGLLSQIVLFALAPDMFAGLAVKWNDSARGIIADDYFVLPCFGQLYGSVDLNMEELAAAAPQLIIDIGQAKKTVARDMDALEARTGIPSVHIEASLDGMADAYRKLGTLLGREEKAEELARFCESVYDRTAAIMEKVGENRVRVLYLPGTDGLKALAKDSYHAGLIDMLTDNVAVVDSPVASGFGNAVTLEQIALWDPDVILFAPHGIFASVPERAGWKELGAVRNRRCLEVPEGPHNWLGTPPSVQRCLGMIWLTAALYPEYCNYDVKADVLAYYSLFYGCELTDKQYAALTANAFFAQ